MPLYDYKCEECHTAFTIVSTIAKLNTLAVTCEKCSSPNVKRIITTTPAVVYKTKGFYSTDSKSKT